MGSWLLALLGKRSAASTGIGLDPVGLSLRGFAPSTVFQRRYRMDASILLLGAPLFTRQAAGGAYASVEISRDPDATAMALQFAAGSDPARAHGLNRFGILREAVVIRGPGRGDATELSFAGLMTWSREESLEQGKKALASSTGGAEGLIARGRTNGSGGESKIQTWIDTLDLGPDCNWSNVYATLSGALRHEPQTPPRESSAGAATTFLHAMRGAALCQDILVRRQFLHAGKLYWLETRRHAEHILELAGTIHDLAGARRADFRTTYAAGDESGIPIRIEYRPRSFLRLTFEVERETGQSAIPSVFPSDYSKESA
ncbi:MAG: hypothetical protein ACLPWF_29855 [Bryobacteraceae bacterium]